MEARVIKIPNLESQLTVADSGLRLLICTDTKVFTREREIYCVEGEQVSKFAVMNGYRSKWSHFRCSSVSPGSSRESQLNQPTACMMASACLIRTNEPDLNLHLHILFINFSTVQF